jgi:hypothetical protein
LFFTSKPISQYFIPKILSSERPALEQNNFSPDFELNLQIYFWSGPKRQPFFSSSRSRLLAGPLASHLSLPPRSRTPVTSSLRGPPVSTFISIDARCSRRWHCRPSCHRSPLAAVMSLRMPGACASVARATCTMHSSLFPTLCVESFPF